ncbi:MAG: PDZ domain-containing protein, partial [Acidobacteria bacterium]|nr:PDZ domain-containing protein [Acidobacteriota bacterium]
MYLIAASFLSFFLLFFYGMFWGPEPLGIEVEYAVGAVRITSVSPESPAMRVGLQPGDAIVAVDGQAITG